MKKKIYGRWFIWEEFVGIPMIVYHWIKGDRIKNCYLKELIKQEKTENKLN